MEANQEINQNSNSKNDDMKETEEQKVAEEQNIADEVAEVSVEEQLAQLESDKKDLNNNLLRSMADIENIRKRHQKEKSDLAKYGNEKLMEDLLPVLDSFAKAIESQDGEAAEAYVEGVKMVFQQLISITEKHGLKGFDSKGSEFDPNIHQAIQKVEEEVDDETVKEEFQRGYHLNERLLRPAIVSVSVPGSKE